MSPKDKLQKVEELNTLNKRSPSNSTELCRIRQLSLKIPSSTAGRSKGKDLTRMGKKKMEPVSWTLIPGSTIPKMQKTFQVNSKAFFSEICNHNFVTSISILQSLRCWTLQELFDKFQDNFQIPTSPYSPRRTYHWFPGDLYKIFSD